MQKKIVCVCVCVCDRERERRGVKPRDQNVPRKDGSIIEVDHCLAWQNGSFD